LVSTLPFFQRATLKTDGLTIKIRAKKPENVRNCESWASRSPVRILESLFRWASLSVAGFFVLVGSMMGYFLGTVFLLVAALKPFHPQTAGLWLLRDSAGDPEISIRLGFGSVPAAGRDVLGWWIVPIGLLAGCAVLMLTTRFALWCARQYRRSHLLPRS
jgi:hypothetical protein